MANINVNLLKNKRVLSEKDYQREKNILRQSVVGLIVIVVLIVALSVVNLMTTHKLAGVEQSLTKVTKEIQGYADASAQQIYLSSRLKLISGFLVNRSIIRDSLQRIFSMNIAGVHVSGVTFENNDILGVQYEADSSQAIQDLLKYYQDDEEYFIQATSRGITRTKNGSYQLRLALSLPK